MHIDKGITLFLFSLILFLGASSNPTLAGSGAKQENKKLRLSWENARVLSEVQYRDPKGVTHYASLLEIKLPQLDLDDADAGMVGKWPPQRAVKEEIDGATPEGGKKLLRRSRIWLADRIQLLVDSLDEPKAGEKRTGKVLWVDYDRVDVNFPIDRRLGF